ncbi:unnamed protein product [Acanthoscelides obtectus]|nr:unnamed protein product [Acanthoscelides obtectus]CAK1664502.1 1-acyl-sn-glycerol-3-phosphate acyltransferase delta [Acanthoscelides obtectus]
MLFGKQCTAHIYFKRIPLEEIPEEEAAQEKFLRDRFVIRDKLKESFLKTGDFFATSGVPRVEPFEMPRRFYPVINVLVWLSVTLIPISYYLIKLFFSGEILYFSIGAGIIGAFFLLLNKTVGMSEIKKGSSYGTTTPKKTS